MSDFVPAIITLAVFGAIFAYGYLTDPCRPRTTARVPAHGEPNPPSNLNPGKVPNVGEASLTR